MLPDWPGLRGARHALYNRGQLHGRSLADSVAELDDVVTTVTAARRRSPAEQPDLVSICLRARDKETGEGMGDQQIRDEILTFLLAGHETTAVALTWTALELAWNPEVARNLKAELDSVLQGRMPTYSDLPRLRYTRAVFAESMRLHPPAWRMSRKALEDDEVAGYRVPRGSTVVTSPYLLHHSPALWSHPERFRPERFLNDSKEPGSPFGYIPFGVGPRKCVGNHLATVEAIIILASYCQRFRFTIAPGFTPELDPKLTLRIRGEVPIHLEDADGGRCARESEGRTSEP
jgi:cytochrome P450